MAETSVSGVRAPWVPNRIADVATGQLVWRGLWPRVRPKSPRRDRRVALTFDCDYDRDEDAVPAVVETLAGAQAAASFAVIGTAVAANPAPYRLLADGGFELINHSMTHPFHPVHNSSAWFRDLTEDEACDEMRRAQEVVHSITGQIPVGFRTPHFSDSVLVLRAAERVGFRYITTFPQSRTLAGRPYRPPSHGGSGRFDMYLTHTAVGARPSSLDVIPLATCPEHPQVMFSSYHTVRRETGTASGERGQHRPRGEALGLWDLMLRCSDGPICVYLDPMDLSDNLSLLSGMITATRDHGWALVQTRDLCVTRTGSSS